MLTRLVELLLVLASVVARIKSFFTPPPEPMPENAPDELDVVRFAEDVQCWPSGTEATVLDKFPEGAMVEIADGEGRMLDTPLVPYSALEVIWRMERPP